MGMIAGTLTHTAGPDLAESVLAGGASFATCMGLCLNVIHVLQARSPNPPE